MKFTIDKQEKYYQIQINEEKVDTIIAPDLKSEFVKLNAEGVRNVILDLSMVKYVDSSGLSSILVANRLCTNINGQMVIVGISDHVMKLISISQLDKVLNILPTPEEARDAIFMHVIENEIDEDDEKSEE